MKFCQRGLEGSPLLLAEWKCVPDDSLSCLSNPELRRMAPWTNFSFDILQFLSLRNFCPGGRILLFNTSFGNLRTRAFILDHKKGVFKHFKGLKNADAATADLIRVVLAEILDFLCIRSEGSPTTLVQGKRVLNDPNLSLVTVYHGFGPLGTHFNWVVWLRKANAWDMAKMPLGKMGFKGHWRGPTWIRLFVNMLGMMYDGCLDGAHLDKLFLKHIFLNFFWSKAKVWDFGRIWVKKLRKCLPLRQIDLGLREWLRSVLLHD